MMVCPYCQGDVTRERERTTALGYHLFRRRPCRRTFNERTGTPFNHLQAPTDIALLVVLWRLRYKLSLRDLTPRCSSRGASPSPTRPCERGRRASLPCSRISDGPSDGAKRA